MTWLLSGVVLGAMVGLLPVAPAVNAAGGPITTSRVGAGVPERSLTSLGRTWRRVGVPATRFAGVNGRTVTDLPTALIPSTGGGHSCRGADITVTASRWVNVVTGASGTLQTDGELAGPSPDGYLTLRPNGASVDLVNRHAAAGTSDLVATLSGLPTAVTGRSVQVSCDLESYVVVIGTPSVATILFGTWTSGAPAVFDASAFLDPTWFSFGSGVSTSYGLVSLGRNVVRVDAMGLTPTTLPNPPEPGPNQYAINGDSVAWGLPNGQQLGAVRRPDGTIIKVTKPSGEPLDTNSVRVFVEPSPTGWIWSVDTVGSFISSTTAATATPEWVAWPMAPSSEGLVMSAGRVSWTETAPTSGAASTYSRGVTSTVPVTLDDQTRLGEAAPPLASLIAASSRRTATPGAPASGTLLLHDGVSMTSIPFTHGTDALGNFTMSGHVVDYGQEEIDLATGRTSARSTPGIRWADSKLVPTPTALVFSSPRLGLVTHPGVRADVFRGAIVLRCEQAGVAG